MVYSLCKTTGLSTCGTPFTFVPRRSWRRAHALVALACSPAAADASILRYARLGAGAAVAVFPDPTVVTTTLPAVTHSVTYKA